MVAGGPASSQNCSTLKRASDFATDLKLEHPQHVEKYISLETVCVTTPLRAEPACVACRPQLLPAIVVQYAEDGTAKVPEPEKS